MTARGERRYLRKDNGKVLSDDDIYQIVMLYTYQRIPVDKIAKRFSISTIDARSIIGRRTGGSCCG